jgi:hypothetical protein
MFGFIGACNGDVLHDRSSPLKHLGAIVRSAGYLVLHKAGAFGESANHRIHEHFLCSPLNQGSSRAIPAA